MALCNIQLWKKSGCFLKYKKRGRRRRKKSDIQHSSYPTKPSAFLEVLPGYSALMPTGTMATVTTSLCKVICPQLWGLSLLTYLRICTTSQLSVVAVGSLWKALSVCWQGRKNDCVMQVILQCTVSWPGLRGGAGWGRGKWKQVNSFMIIAAITVCLSKVAFFGVWMWKLVFFECKKSWKTFTSWTDSKSLFHEPTQRAFSIGDCCNNLHLSREQKGKENFQKRKKMKWWLKGSQIKVCRIWSHIGFDASIVSGELS